MVAQEMFKIVESAYGKVNVAVSLYKTRTRQYFQTGVKILHVSRKAGVSTIRELEVVTLLTLDNTKVTMIIMWHFCDHNLEPLILTTGL